MSYTPQPDSLAGRVCAFFSAHPDEELSSKDIAQKFDVASSSVSALLGTCLSHQFLVRGKDAGGVGVFRAGPKLAAPAPAATPSATGIKSWLTSKGQPSAEGRRPAAVMPPPKELRIEDGIEIPANTGPRAYAYEAVFASMQKGQSFKCTPEAAKRLVASARRWGKTCGRKFITRQVDAGISRIWRTE